MENRSSKRIMKDIEAVSTEATQKQGIFYSFDTSNIYNGKALIVGHDGTPYEGLLGLFEIKIPKEYPFAPPAVEWKTSDGVTRFHPQLYVAGKVCLSILGTWTGPGWSSMMNLESVLQILQSLFVENPLACEPGYEKGTLEEIRFKEYRNLVEYNVVKYMFNMLQSWFQNKEEHIWAPFEEEITPILPGLFEKLKKKTQTVQESSWSSHPLGSAIGSTNWVALRTLVPKIETGFLSMK